MAQTITSRKRVRKFFGKIKEVAEMPNLIEVQKASYDRSEEHTSELRH